MTKEDPRHGLNRLAEVPDKRNPRGKRHPLSAILSLSVIAMMCGYRSYSAIAQWGRTYPPEFAKTLGFTHPKTPCASTLHYCFNDLDVVALEKTLSEWATDVFAATQEDDKNAVAIDGKTLCGSLTQDAQITHLLSVVTHQLGITLTQRPVSDKTNEIPIASRILEAFDVAGKVVTTDALLTQRSFCQDLCDADADYVMPVKENHPTLLEDIRAVFESEHSDTRTSHPTKTGEQGHKELGARTGTCTTVEKDNGWLQTRTMTTSTLLIGTGYVDWPGLAQVYQYKTEREHTRTGEKSTMTQYGITSLTPECGSAERILMLRRGHWAIENLSHRTRDVLFDEDASQVRCGNIPQVMCALRNATISLLRTSGNTEIAYAFRYFAAKPKEALMLLGANIDN